MRPRALSTCLILALAILCLPSAGMADSSVAGRLIVPGDGGAAAAGILVELVDLDRGDLRTVRTDATGAFAFHELPEGRYELQVYAEGFAPVDAIRIEPPLAEELEISLTRQRSAADGDFAVVRVLYATDRAIADGVSPVEAPSEYYGGARGELSFGVSEVSVPRDHKMGELESPSIFRFQLRQNPAKHVVLMRIFPEAEERFLERVEAERSAFVFVHGYNVSFRDAARRSAQMHYDLGFDGAAVFYSWPSRAELDGYVADTNAARWTVPNLTRFLELMFSAELDTLHLIAHSMGNQAVTLALERLVADGVVQPDRRFNQIALVAPDLDAETFRRDIAPRILPAGGRVSLYASANDEALSASKMVSGYPRAGHIEGVRPAAGVETIDVSEIDSSLLGHSYFGDNTSVISDLRKLFQGLPPHTRELVPMTTENGDRYWKFVAPN